MAYDSAIISYTTKTDKVDLVQAAHMNAVQSELVTIETILGTNVKGNLADLKTRLNNMLDPDGSLLSGTSFPSPALGSQLFYRTDLTTTYAHNISTGVWDALGGSLSNLIYRNDNNTQAVATTGIITTTNLTTPASAEEYKYWSKDAGTSYVQLGQAFKWTKISGVSTLTVYAKVWQDGAGGDNALFKLVVGSVEGISGTVSSATTTPTVFNWTVDVSSLTNGTTYDCNFAGKKVSNTETIFMGEAAAFGS